MKGLLTSASTVRSARMWVISPGRWAIWASGSQSVIQLMNRGVHTFPNGLQSVYPLRILFPDLHNLSKAALPNDFQKVESFDRQSLVATGFEVNLEVEGTRAGCGGIPLVRGVLQLD